MIATASSATLAYFGLNMRRINGVILAITENNAT